jgi:hypothetical protein
MKRYKLVIESDSEPCDPREWDNLGKMICFHSRYNLGDSHNMTIDDCRDLEENKEHIVLPLYLYDHSGITMNTTGFSCRFDSGKVGIIYVTKKQIREEYSWKNLTKKRIEQIKEYLKNEVKTYDDYLTGNVYGFTLFDNDNEIDSCWGFVGRDYKTNGILDHISKEILEDCEIVEK